MSHRDRVLEAAALALTDGEKEPLAIATARIPALKTALEASYGDASLPTVVEDLCLFACWIGSAKKSPHARDALIEVAEGAFDALKAFGDRAEAVLAEVEAARASRDYSKLTGKAKERFEPRAPNTKGVAAGPLAKHRLQGKKKKEEPS